MKIIALLIIVIGFVPAFITAGTTNTMLNFIDYASALMGFLIGCTVMEVRSEVHNV